jgi:hypothetical protein
MIKQEVRGDVEWSLAEDGPTMITYLILAFILGALLSQRFTVLSLLWPIALLLMIGVAAVIVRVEDGWSIVLWAVALAVTLQAGYLGGLVIRLTLGTAPKTGNWLTNGSRSGPFRRRLGN